MKFRKRPSIWLSLSALVLVASATTASAAVTTLSVVSTSLGRIVVNGKGMTAYFYDLDKPHSGISRCTGGCSTNWPAITSSTTRIDVAGLKGKVTILGHTRQLAINGRPVYTFIGDTSKGSTNGQGVGGVWFAVSANGTEFKPSELPMPTITPKSASTPTASPTPAVTPPPTDSASPVANSNSNY